MNIIFYLFSNFLKEEYFSAILLLCCSIVLSIIQSGGISYITANILHAIQEREIDIVWNFFKYFIIISIIFIIIIFIYNSLHNIFITKLRQWIRTSLVKMLLKVNNEKYSDINFTQLTAPINRVSSISYLFFDDIINYVIPYITFLFIISIYFSYKIPIFGIVFIISNILLLIYTFANIQHLIKYNSEYEKVIIDNESYLVDLFNNMDKIIYRGETNAEIDIFWNRGNKAINCAYKLFNAQNIHELIATIIIYIILFVSMYYLIYLTIQNKLDITSFITFFTILLLYREKIEVLIQQIPQFIEFIGRAESVFKHFKDTETEFLLTQNVKYDPIDLEFNSIQFKDVTFKYEKSENYLFKNKNILVYTNNKIIGVTGLSGNGKSTFAKLILKLYKPVSGNVFIDNVDINTIDTDYIRKNITYVNQNSKLFDKKILDNILYGCKDLDACNGHLEEILKYPKIQELYRNISFTNTQSGSLGENLSGGQRQVINLIGGLVNPTKILILDEPTNALDPALKKEVLGLILDFKKYKKCIIIITHDKDVFPLFNESIKF
jgi:ABC-type bacteriocin/lantibiotic exporter with double-glycine peptidase domain